MLFTDNYCNAPEYWGVMGGNMFRPHAIASDGTTYMVVDTDNNRVNTYIKDLDGYYTRSFTIDGDKIYLPSMGRSAIYAVDKNSFQVSAVYPVCADLGGWFRFGMSRAIITL